MGGGVVSQRFWFEKGYCNGWYMQRPSLSPPSLSHAAVYPPIQVYRVTLDRVFDKLEKMLKVALHVEQDHGLIMDAQLRPGRDLEQFLHSTISSWKSDKRVCLLASQFKKAKGELPLEYEKNCFSQWKRIWMFNQMTIGLFVDLPTCSSKPCVCAYP